MSRGDDPQGGGLSWSLALRVGLILALGVFCYPALSHAVDVWSTDEEFTYGFLIVPISLGICWWRRAALRHSMGKGTTAGLLIVGSAIVLTLVSRRTGINSLAGLAVSPLLFGLAVYLWGWRAGRVVAFPAGFLIFGLVLYRGLLNSVGFALQDLTAKGAALLGQAVGLNVIRDGLVLHSAANSPQYAFVVAQACSGMSSLLALLSLAALWIYATRGPLPGKLAVFLGVVPLVIIANTLRVTLVLVVAAAFGEDAALGFFHGASSLVLFGLALVGLLMLSRTVGCKLPTFAISS
ncbi:MAG TPA: exosortase/archaeosortase family protein [Chloroflexota bacterium]|nr:exosortase/archaeosortase family protein [Chloroflexota bacterium]